MVVRLGVDAASAAQATQAPLSWLLVALLTTVGPPFLVLAVSASVLQATFASTRHESARDPYFLIAASNAGSLAGARGLPDAGGAAARPQPQARVWTIGYCGFVLLQLACAVAARFALRDGEGSWRYPRRQRCPTSRLMARGALVRAGGVPSSLMLGRDDRAHHRRGAGAAALGGAARPLSRHIHPGLWDRGASAPRAWPSASCQALLLGLSVTMMLRTQLPLLLALEIHLLAVLAAPCCVTGRLAQERPSARHLTEFYFWLAFGGMAGGCSTRWRRRCSSRASSSTRWRSPPSRSCGRPIRRAGRGSRSTRGCRSRPRSWRGGAVRPVARRTPAFVAAMAAAPASR
jgi:hypothetical protein